MIPFALVFAVGLSQTLYNLNTYSYSKDKLSTFRRYIDYEQGTYNLYFNSNEIYKYFNRYILEKSGHATGFQGFTQEGYGFEEHTTDLMETRENKLKILYNSLYAYSFSNDSSAFDMIMQAPCAVLKSKNVNPSLLPEKTINEEFCKNLADGLAGHSFLKSFMWLRTQERLIRAEIDEKSGVDLFDVFKSKMFIDYELYLKFIFNEYMVIYNVKFENELRKFSDEVNDMIQLLSIYGVFFSALLVSLAYWNYHQRSSGLFVKSMYIVKLIPYQTLSENTYVKSRFMRILGLNSY